MTNIKQKILLAVGLLFLLIIGVTFSSDVNEASGDSGFVYLFHLYYDQGQLFSDRDFQFKYDLIAEEYVGVIVNPASAYQGEVVMIGGNKVRFQFDPLGNDASLKKGKISVKGPYSPNADLVNFYSPSGEKLLTVSVRESSVCNDNNICDAEVGEDYKNCPADCLAPTPSASTPLETLPIKIDWILYAWGGGGIAVLLLVLWLIRVWLKNKNKNEAPPPQI
ncbi:MAG: hypothetical protein Q7S32_03770 [bacterium]|nr:hypothetical protein [bacterium]